MLPESYRECLEPPATAGLRAGLAHAAEAAAALVYPPHCLACGLPLPPMPNRVLCGGCAERIEWVGADRCTRCGDRVGEGRGSVDGCPSCAAHPPVYVTQSATLARYAEPLRALILGLKFGAGLQAVPLLAALLARRVRDTRLLEGARPLAAIVPVPLARKDFRARGFNQAEELARDLGRRLSLPVETRMLRKVRATSPQATLDADARRENLRGAFEAAPREAARYMPSAVLLLDDVITTGSTIGECARTLRQAGVAEVRAAAVARG
ncbi:MAG: double zinc ribbon domain-containing protein [Planctomycetota bacterium]|nr:double zinc ribbon domain-containing protein [Planctomycetota bacterium]